ncbi:Holliday junction ATP-dependent DNA helicase RuvA [bioreactor metagenome]|uniref:Holliday junction ATP-dependent DNA helicase RuvA n=1 Tax=bioreactor metagenome TaxID=1076179 RepID=A0A645FVW7_9ZZZZ
MGQLADIGSTVTLLTILIHRDDAMLLYGFYNEAERELFKLLTAISGVGPKGAMDILSASIFELKRAILTENITFLMKLPKVGKKTAERLIIELRDKIGKIDTDNIADKHIADSNEVKQEAVLALIALGYNKAVAEKTVSKAIASLNNELSKTSVEDIIRLALKLALS